MKTLRVEPVAGTTIAEDKDSARRIRELIIVPALENGEELEIDFEQVSLATQSFIHALLASPLRQFGIDALDLISFKNCSDAVQEVIRTVVRYTLAADRIS